MNEPVKNHCLHIALTSEYNKNDDQYYYYLYMGGQLQQSFFVQSGNTDSKNIDNIAPYQNISQITGSSNICIGYNGSDALFGDVESIKISKNTLYTSRQSSYITPPLQLEQDKDTTLIVQYLETDIIDNSPNGYNVNVVLLSNAPILTPRIVHITQSPCN
jgi:hypothetical protein